MSPSHGGILKRARSLRECRETKANSFLSVYQRLRNRPGLPWGHTTANPISLSWSHGNLAGFWESCGRATPACSRELRARGYSSLRSAVSSMARGRYGPGTTPNSRARPGIRWRREPWLDATLSPPSQRVAARWYSRHRPIEGSSSGKTRCPIAAARIRQRVDTHRRRS